MYRKVILTGLWALTSNVSRHSGLDFYIQPGTPSLGLNHPYPALPISIMVGGVASGPRWLWEKLCGLLWPVKPKGRGVLAGPVWLGSPSPSLMTYHEKHMPCVDKDTRKHEQTYGLDLSPTQQSQGDSQIHEKTHKDLLSRATEILRLLHSKSQHRRLLVNILNLRFSTESPYPIFSIYLNK